MLREHFAGVIPIDEFLNTYLPKPGSEGSAVPKIVKQCAPKLKVAAGELPKASNENEMSPPLITYLKQVVSTFPDTNKPLFEDTHHTKIPPLDEGDHYTMPDIIATQPGMKNAPEKWRWPYVGTVVELKFETDVIDKEGKINNRSDESKKALVQLAKSARSLLMASGSCHVYVVAVFARNMARIFRFDRACFRPSSAFNWLEEKAIFPTFFYRLYNPDGRPGRMYGQDDTISIPTSAEKTKMYKALCKHVLYKDLYPEEEQATKDSLWIMAGRFPTDEGADEDTPVAQIVKCFTIGPILSCSDGLFSRATRVYRVIIEEDAKNDSPTVYALKDSWREEFRRPEVDFYDVIARYCKENPKPADEKGMARCHGSVDLSLARKDEAPIWDIALHTTSATSGFQRLHTRSLLTPVGSPLNDFSSSKVLVEALHRAIIHHQIAYNAGVLHRDISEGNVLFDETTRIPQGFLLDWDYAEFTPEGMANFNKWFPKRKELAASKKYTEIDKSMKDMTGTFPFMAIEIMPIENTTIHGPHHDLESFFWLLIWMILRHTNHHHSDKGLACAKLFDASDNRAKKAWLHDFTPVQKDSPLYKIAERLRELVVYQNPVRTDPDLANNPFYDPSHAPSPAVAMTHTQVVLRFKWALALKDWPTNDRAVPFYVPSSDPVKDEKLKARSHRQNVLVSGSGGLKRTRPEDDDSSTAVSTSSGAAASLSGTGSASKKAKTESHPEEAQSGEPRRSGRARKTNRPFSG
ncbi:hypothetical protein C8R44DRAFT_770049 [Mycena epipterygia]|nr:hypothetical protein C8R44DRAFT_770049 [Mycena epipterygia]